MDTSNKSSNKKVRKQYHIYKNFQLPKDEAERLLKIFKTKEICLLVITELIREIDSLFDKGFKNVHQVLNTPNKLYSNVINPEKLFLLKVKQEIELLSD